ncbi:hypothetical protein B7494_g2869 [Chlorociboria aeruginascens]|nr:hypothetical protein B7494_g2869 [Chlorociboria aeruginascens]
MSTLPKWRVQSLPQEILSAILLPTIFLSQTEKNSILELRLTCRAFDAALRPYLFKTLQLEFSTFSRPPDVKALARVGNISEAVYIDMMVVRDEEEISRLLQLFNALISRVPEMETQIDSLRQYCMDEDGTFGGIDFRTLVNAVFQMTSNMTRLKLNLPFQIVGSSSQTATVLLATTFECLAKRPEESKVLETLVLDHLSDKALNDICRNHMDLENSFRVLSGLKHLVLSIKRQDSRDTSQRLFAHNLWLLIRKAVILETLCIIGCNVKRDKISRRNHSSSPITEWMMRSLPFPSQPESKLKNLRCLELKRLDIEPIALVSLIEEVSPTLKELYLNEVYIKVNGRRDQEKTPLWIGHASIPKPKECLWIAPALFEMPDLHLEIIRVTGLGYDDYEPDRNSANPNYDLVDTTDVGRSFDQRFVDAAGGLFDFVKNIENNSLADSSADPAVPPRSSHEVFSPAALSIKYDYDAETFQRFHNSTSHYKRCIDGYFFNHNEPALRELQKIIKVADAGMALISEEIDRSHALTIDPSPLSTAGDL